MTVGLNNRNDYVGTGATDTYAYGFRAILNTDLQVTQAVIATGVETPLVLTTDYTVTGVGDANGGNVVLVAGNLAATDRLTIRSAPPSTQTADIKNQGAFFPKTYEDALDKIVRLVQKNEDATARSVKAPETVSTTDFDPVLPDPTVSGSAGKTFTVNDAENGWELTAVSIPAVQAIADDAQASADAAAADAVSTAADAVSTAADAVSTAADVVSSAASAASAAASAGSINANNVTWYCRTTTTAVILSGSYFTGVDSSTLFTFTSNRTFDITGTAGTVGSLNTGSEAADTHYYLIAIADTTATIPPHIIAVTEANYASFTTADLTGNYSGYNDYKRIGSVRNDGSSNLGRCEYVNQKVYSAEGQANDPYITTSSATLTDIDYSGWCPAYVRSGEFQFNIGSGVGAQTGAVKYKDHSASEFEVIHGQTGDTHYATSDILLSTSQIFEAKISQGALDMVCIAYDDDLLEEGQ